MNILFIMSMSPEDWRMYKSQRNRVNKSIQVIKTNITLTDSTCPKNSFIVQDPYFIVQ